MKYLMVLAPLFLVGCGSLPVTEAFVEDRLTTFMERVDSRVAIQGEDFDTALKAETEALKEELGAEAESLLPGILGDQLPVGGGILGAIALWILRNKTRQKNGIASTLLTGLKAPKAE